MRPLLAALRRSNYPWPWTNVYGVARSLLACGTLGTLLAQNSTVLFTPFGVRLNETAPLGSLSGFSLFFLVPKGLLEPARWFAIGVLILVIIGWRPRITAFAHWWVSYSFSSACFVTDGGDHVATVMTALLLPVALLDPRRSQWETLAGRPTTHWQQASALTAWSAFVVARLQVAGIYFHAVIGKLGVQEWADGTAAYYWFLHPVFGLPSSLRAFALPVLATHLGVTALTWGALATESLMILGLTAPKKWWPTLLAIGLGFHFAIVLVHGLASFFCSMAGALVLYLRPKNRPFSLRSRRAALAGRAEPAPAGRWRTPVAEPFHPPPLEESS